MDEDVDIYGDLPSFDINECTKVLCKEKIEELTKKNLQLEQDALSWKVKCEILEEGKKTILHNTSSLMKTARAEINRKDRIITELRKELEDLKFKRGHWAKANQKNAETKNNKKWEAKRLNEESVKMIAVDPPPWRNTRIPEEEENPEQIWGLEREKMTLYGERLKKKILMEQEAEKIQKEAEKIEEAERIKKEAEKIKETQRIQEVQKIQESERIQKEVEKINMSEKIQPEMEKIKEPEKFKEEMEKIKEPEKIEEEAKKNNESDKIQQAGKIDKSVENHQDDEKLEMGEEIENVNYEIKEEGETDDSSDDSYTEATYPLYTVIESNDIDELEADDKCPYRKNRRYGEYDNRDEMQENYRYFNCRVKNEKHIENSYRREDRSRYPRDSIHDRPSRRREIHDRSRRYRDNRGKSNHRSRSKTPDRRQSDDGKRYDKYRPEIHRRHVKNYENRQDRSRNKCNEYNGREIYNNRDRLERRNDGKFGNNYERNNYENRNNYEGKNNSESRSNYDNYKNDGNYRRAPRSKSPSSKYRSRSSGTLSRDYEKRSSRRSRSRERFLNSEFRIESDRDRDKKRDSRDRKVAEKMDSGRKNVERAKNDCIEDSNSPWEMEISQDRGKEEQNLCKKKFDEPREVFEAETASNFIDFENGIESHEKRDKKSKSRDRRIPEEFVSKNMEMSKIDFNEVSNSQREMKIHKDEEKETRNLFDKEFDESRDRKIVDRLDVEVNNVVISKKDLIENSNSAKEISQDRVKEVENLSEKLDESINRKIVHAIDTQSDNVKISKDNCVENSMFAKEIFKDRAKEMEISTGKFDDSREIIEAAVDTVKNLLNQVEAQDTFILMLENDSEVSLMPVTRNEILSDGSISFREEKIENIEKFIHDYPYIENSLLGTGEIQETNDEDNRGNTTNSIVDTLSMDIDEVLDKNLENGVLDNSRLSMSIDTDALAIDEKFNDSTNSDKSKLNEKIENLTVVKKTENLTNGHVENYGEDEKLEDLPVSEKSKELTIGEKPQKLETGAKSKNPSVSNKLNELPIDEERKIFKTDKKLKRSSVDEKLKDSASNEEPKKLETDKILSNRCTKEKSKDSPIDEETKNSTTEKSSNRSSRAKSSNRSTREKSKDLPVDEDSKHSTTDKKSSTRSTRGKSKDLPVDEKPKNSTTNEKSSNRSTRKKSEDQTFDDEFKKSAPDKKSSSRCAKKTLEDQTFDEKLQKSVPDKKSSNRCARDKSKEPDEQSKNLKTDKKLTNHCSKEKLKYLLFDEEPKYSTTDEKSSNRLIREKSNDPSVNEKPENLTTEKKSSTRSTKEKLKNLLFDEEPKNSATDEKSSNRLVRDKSKDIPVHEEAKNVTIDKKSSARSTREKLKYLLFDEEPKPSLNDKKSSNRSTRKKSKDRSIIAEPKNLENDKKSINGVISEKSKDPSIDELSKSSMSDKNLINNCTSEKMAEPPVVEESKNSEVENKSSNHLVSEKSIDLPIDEPNKVPTDEKSENLAPNDETKNNTAEKTLVNVDSSKSAQIVDLKKTFSEISPPLPPSPQLPPPPPLPPCSPISERKNFVSEEINPVKSDNEKVQAEKILPRQTKKRPRIPCAPIVSLYSRKRRELILTDSVASHTVIKSSTNEIDGQSETFKNPPVSRIIKSVPKPTIKSSKSTLPRDSTNEESLEKLIVESRVISGEKNIEQDISPKPAIIGNENSSVESSEFPNTSEKMSDSEKGSEVPETEETKPEVECKRSQRMKNSAKIEKNSTSRSSERETRSALKTIASTDPGTSNRKRPLSREKENQSKPAKQPKIMIISRRKPVQLEDSSTATTLVSSANENFSKDEIPPKIGVTSRKRRLADK